MKHNAKPWRSFYSAFVEQFMFGKVNLNCLFNICLISVNTVGGQFTHELADNEYVIPAVLVYEWNKYWHQSRRHSTFYNKFHL